MSLSSYNTLAGDNVAGALQQFVSTTSQDVNYSSVLDQLFLMIPLAIAFLFLFTLINRR